MPSERPGNKAKAIFDEAAEIASAVERAAYLDRACGGDQDLRREVETLLRALDEAGSFLEAPPDLGAVADPEAGAGEALTPGSGRVPSAENATSANVAADAVTGTRGTSPVRPIVEGPGSVIGRYKLREEIGEGGMGSVYLAEQSHPVKRKVALKLIKAGMDSKTVLARFESERQALALMDHPNIAKVLDAGTTDTGRPYFVMELVKGIPLTDYCDQHRLGLLERLTLFRQICSAVQHAHQKGIIHRDLKPSNILVESHDGNPVPKVIDFGLAKATSGLQLSEHSLYSAFGSVAGTPLYMAPEQASFSAIDVDTRADIYALGVILYELLTGSTPIERETFKKAALDEMLRLIREVEPPTPSSRISTSEARANIAAIRQIEPARLGRFVRGDLDWIVMKALSKERQRRYESPIAFAHDIERFLNHEPVSAGPPTAAYWVRKFVRRHRAQVIAASLVLMALVAGMLGTTLGLVEAKRQERIADAQRQKAEDRLKEIEKINGLLTESVRRETKANVDLSAANTQVQARFDLAMEAIKTFHTGVAEDVLLKNPNLQPVRDRLLKGAADFYKRLGGQLSGQADRRSRQAMAQAYAEMAGLAGQIGATEQAIASQRQAMAARRELALGPDADDEAKAEIGRILIGLGTLLHGTGRRDQALASYAEACTLLKGLTHANPSVTGFQSDLAKCRTSIGNVQRETGMPREALASYQAALAIQQPLADSKPGVSRYQSELAVTLSNTGVLLCETGKSGEALAALERARAIKQTLAVANPAVAQFRSDLAGTENIIGNLLNATGKPGEALASYQAALAIQQALADAQPAVTQFQNDLANSHNNIGLLLSGIGKPGDALASYQTARRILATLADANPTIDQFQNELALSHNNIGLLLREIGKPTEAMASYKAALAILRTLANANPAVTAFQGDLAMIHNNIGLLLLESDKPREALASYEAARAIRHALARANPDLTQFQGDLASIHNNIGAVLKQTGERAQALTSFEAARAIQQALTDAHPAVTQFQRELANTHTNIGIMLKETGSSGQALASFRAALAIQQALAGANPGVIQFQINLANTQLETGDTLRLAGHPEQAQASYDSALAIIAKVIEAQPTLDDYCRVYQVFGLKGLGATQQTAGQIADAVANLRRAVALVDQLRSPSLELLSFLADCHARLGGIAGAAGSGLSAAERAAELDTAIVVLRRAVDGGYRNVNWMKRDPDLDPLRARPDFQALMMDLEFPTEPFTKDADTHNR